MTKADIRKASLTKPLKPGDIIYRYAFHFSTGKVEKLVATVTHSHLGLVMYSYDYNGKTATSSTRAFMDGSITTKGTSKYVWLAEDDFDKAKDLVKGALEDRKADILKSLESVNTCIETLDGMKP